MIVKMGGCHPRVIAFGFSFRDSIPLGMSSYVCITKKISAAVMRRPLRCTPFFGQKNVELKVFSRVRR
jgi:hypothetical protein